MIPYHTDNNTNAIRQQQYNMIVSVLSIGQLYHEKKNKRIRLRIHQNYRIR